MAINGTMEIIQSLTVGSGGTASIDFTNIPATYDDLKILLSARYSGAPADGMYIAFNGSSSNFTGRYLFGNGSGAASANLERYVGSVFGTSTANVFNSTEIYIPDYKSSANKSFYVENVAENNASTAYQNLITGLWSNVSAITSISIVAGASFLQNTTATLYGVTRIPALAKATGGVITEDSTHWYHTFTSSGVFTPTQSITADYIVVAGGGGTGNGYFVGGGGAGGYRALTSQSLTSNTNYTVTIGAGGVGGSDISGSNSVFGPTTSAGGGRGGGGYGPSDSRNSGSAGGSGGGGSGGNSPYGGVGGAGNTPSVSPSQGNSGGNGSNQGGAGTNVGAGGGGGGAGGSGGNGNVPANTGGAGGVGIFSSLTNAMGAATSTGQLSGGNYYYAGGGGGGQERTGSSPAVTAGPAGLGGGGIGGIRGLSAPGNGTANTGGGGGGSGGDAFDQGGTGGSGIVIVRYPK
jgi:hypothetical protein